MKPQQRPLTLVRRTLSLTPSPQVMIFRANGSDTEEPQRFQLPLLIRQGKFVERAIVWGKGLVVLTSSDELVAITNFKQPRQYRLSPLVLLNAIDGASSGSEDEEAALFDTGRNGDKGRSNNTGASKKKSRNPFASSSSAVLRVTAFSVLLRRPAEGGAPLSLSPKNRSKKLKKTNKNPAAASSSAATASREREDESTGQEEEDESRRLAIIIATSNATVYVVTRDRCEDKCLRTRLNLQSPIVDMSAAPNGHFVACFTKRGRVKVYASDFKREILDFDASTSIPPRQLCWCGEDSVVLYWKSIGMLMVGPKKDWIKYEVSSNETLHLVQEIDCLRVISERSAFYLQRVPPSLESIRTIGSITPGATLVEATDAFQHADPKADALIRAMKERGRRGVKEKEGGGGG